MNEEKQVYAQYDDQTIRVYQAYKPAIAQEALRLQTFGEHFSRTRMTWVKPSFLWMMYRCGWCEKQDQEMCIALDLRHDAFDELLRLAVLTHPTDSRSDAEWRKILDTAPVRVQWDPDRLPDGSPNGRRAIQIGVKAKALDVLLDGIVRIENMTPQVLQWNALRQAGTLNPDTLPQERLYPVTEPEILRKLAMQQEELCTR